MQKQGVYAILDDNIFKKSFGTNVYLASLNREENGGLIMKDSFNLDSVEFESTTESNGAMWPLKNGSECMVYAFRLSADPNAERFSFVLTEDKTDCDRYGRVRYDVSEVYSSLITTADLEQRDIKILDCFRAKNLAQAECRAFEIITDARLEEVAGCAFVTKALSRAEMPLKVEDDLDNTALAQQRRAEELEKERKREEKDAFRASNALKASSPVKGEVLLFA